MPKSVRTLDGSTARSISPTDIAQFIRLGQCERYLRLRLLTRQYGDRVITQEGVRIQPLSPLLMATGRAFEQRTTARISERLPSIICEPPSSKLGSPNNHAELLDSVATLSAGERRVVFQPRLAVDVAGWHLRGDADLIVFERGNDGSVRALLADIKSSTEPKVEHRLQVAFYAEMLESLFAAVGVPLEPTQLGVVFRGPSDPKLIFDAEVRGLREAEAELASSVLGLSHTDGERAYLEIVPDPETYRDAVGDLVTNTNSYAERVLEQPFAEVPFAFDWHCDGCQYNQYCLKQAAVDGDTALIPYVSVQDKGALQRDGIVSIQELASLKVARPDEGGGRSASVKGLIPAPGREGQVRRLAANRQIGGRLDELVLRAQAHDVALRGESQTVWTVPGSGDSSLPRVAADQHANMVWVYLDAQRDYLHDRLYLLGALVVGCENGEAQQSRRRSVVSLSEGPPVNEEIERTLIAEWTRDVIRAVAEVAAPDADTGEHAAPVHLVLFGKNEQDALLDGLARHAGTVLGTTALYDFLNQMPAYDSPLVSQVATEIRERQIYAVVPQSLYRVAERLGFRWDEGAPFKQWFRERVFDYTRTLSAVDTASAVAGGQGANSSYYTGRARFNSGLPLEYAYAVWGELPEPRPRELDELRSIRATTADRLVAFEHRRLAALEHITSRLPSNPYPNKRPFALPELADFEDRAGSYARALEEFLAIERYVELQAWKAIRQREPEQRMANGQTLVVRYFDADQPPDVRDKMAFNRERYVRERAAKKAQVVGEDGKWPKLPPETKWEQVGLQVRLRLELGSSDLSAEEAIALTDFKVDDWAALYERWTTSSAEGSSPLAPYTPTPRQLLYGQRVDVIGLRATTDDDGMSVGWLEVAFKSPYMGKSEPPYVFGMRNPRPLQDGEVYTLDANPDDQYGKQCKETIDGLLAGRPNTLFRRLSDEATEDVHWPETATAGQRRFLDGLAEFERIGALHGFEPSKQSFIGDHGDTPMLMVQGPPGTGKSYTTAFAILARMQGAMAADMDYRVAAGCKTHAATDVLLDNILGALGTLIDLRQRHPDVFAGYFDARLLDIAILRAKPKRNVPPGVSILRGTGSSGIEPGARKGTRDLMSDRWSIVATAPSGIRELDQGQKAATYPVQPFACVVLDEASQMHLPEAIMMCRLLAPDGQVIVVGDHRQMAPIIKHDWDGERRRTFWDYQIYRSLFDTLRARQPALPMIQFAESFRLHTDMAEFLRKEIYRHDGIAYHSRNRTELPSVCCDDPFVSAVLDPSHALVVVVHNEQLSATRNEFERLLMQPILDVLAGELALDSIEGLGVVVPHRAQRAALQAAMPGLAHVSEDGRTTWAIDTVERFQGGERRAMVFGATESEPGYVRTRGDFLFDPRRLTVAMSRAKEKMILIASRSVFDLFVADDEVFKNLQFWKNLLRRTCTVPLWEGERHGTGIEVWGNIPSPVVREPNEQTRDREERGIG